MEYTIQNTYLSVRVSDRGAELQSIQDRDGTEYLWQGDKNTWPDRAPNLFPYIARLTDKQYRYRGELYRMEPHGFLPAAVLKADLHKQNHLVLEICSDEETFRQYPFHFCFRIHYLLTGKKLEICYEVENRDTGNLYFGIGGHPGFQVPLEPGLAFEEYSLVFHNPAEPFRVGMSDDCFVTGDDRPYPLKDNRRIPLRHELFDDDAVILKNMDRTVSLASPNGRKGITVAFPQMDYLGIWHWPKSDAGYVCIEPWSSLPSRKGVIEDLERQDNLVCLPPGQVYENRWSIQIHDGKEKEDV